MSVASTDRKTSGVLLEVRDLQTYFPVRNGTIKAVDGVSFDVERGKTLCVVGESGSGKSVTARSILQIVDEPGRIMGGSMRLHRNDGSSVDLATLNRRGTEIRAVRGAEIAMIFQEPMSSLSPVHTVGNQIMEVLTLHLKMSKQDARGRADVNCHTRRHQLGLAGREADGCINTGTQVDACGTGRCVTG